MSICFKNYSYSTEKRKSINKVATYILEVSGPLSNHKGILSSTFHLVFFPEFLRFYLSLENEFLKKKKIIDLQIHSFPKPE